MLSFARETDDDIATIRAVVTAAFGQTNEAKLVDAIRNSPNFIPELSIVAAEDGDVLGHILFSPIVIAAQGQALWMNIEQCKSGEVHVVPEQFIDYL